MRTKIDFLKGPITTQLLYFALPIMFGSLFQQLYNTVDAMVVGRFVSKQALGAVGGSTGTLINLLVNMVMAFASGANVVIAQYYGRREKDGVKRGVGTAMFMAVTAGFVLGIFGVVIAHVAMKLMQVPSDIYQYSVTYFQIFMLGMLPMMIYNTGAGILRAIGDSKRPLYFLVAACVTNIVLDLLFVVGFRWGVAGAALATVISQVVSCILTLQALKIGEESIRFTLKDLKFDKEMFKRIFSIGFPTAIQWMFYSVANLGIQVKVNTYGTDTVAAYTAFGRIDAFFWNMSGSLGASILTFAGQNFGAGNVDRVRKGIRRAFAIYIVLSVMIAAFDIGMGDYLMMLFTDDADVVKITLAMMRFICPWYFLFSFVEILSMSMRACGDSVVPMIITGIGIGFFRVLWVLVGPDKTVFMPLLCYQLSWLITGVLFEVYYLQGGWLHRSLKMRDKIIQALEK